MFEFGCNTWFHFLYFINFSPMLSTAILLGATIKILLPNFINCNIISIILNANDEDVIKEKLKESKCLVRTCK